MERDKARGGLVGLAVGDALGVPTEFMSREALARDPVKDMRGYGTHCQPPGTWSDDSSLAFCTAEGLVAGYDLKDIGKRFVRWYAEGYWTPHGLAFDVGETTREAIRRLQLGVPPLEAGPTGEENNGNGSLMRILPVAIRFSEEALPTLLEKAHQVSSLTHGHPRSQVACGIHTALARRLLQGGSPSDAYLAAVKETSVFYASSLYANELHHLQRVLGGRLPELAEADVRSDGYVVHTLEAAIWCLLTTEGFEQAVLKAVNLGGDTDTTGAVAGGLAGIAYGLKSIPARWLSQLARQEDVVALAERLWRASVP